MKRVLRAWFILIALGIALLVEGCGTVPPDVKVQKIPISHEDVTRDPEVFLIDNCDGSGDIIWKRVRVLTVDNTVYLDKEDIQSVALALGYSDYKEFLPQLQHEVSERYGIKLINGESVTQEAEIKVAPHKTEVVTLQWKEQWEEGNFKISRGGKDVGQVHYRIMVGLQLVHQTVKETRDCTLFGRAKLYVASFCTRVSILIRSAWSSLSHKLQSIRHLWG